MALTRSFLRGMGLTDEQVSAIIEEHTASTDGLKALRDQYKADAERLPAIQKELDDLKANGGNWETKYNDEHKAFEDFKADIQAKELKGRKTDAFKAFLAEQNIGEKYIDSVLKVSDIDAIDLDEGGAIKDADKLAATVKEQYADFVVERKQGGADEGKHDNHGGGNSVTKEQFAKMSYRQRLELYNNDPETYKTLQNE